MFTIVCHDAGGSELVSSWAINQNEEFNISVSGPAELIFKKKFPKKKNMDIVKCLNNSKWILTSTSSSKNELKAILLAKKNNIKTISFLDHWINFKNRFFYKNKLCLPDELWVSDKYAFKIAKDTFKQTKIKLLF